MVNQMILLKSRMSSSSAGIEFPSTLIFYHSFADNVLIVITKLIVVHLLILNTSFGASSRQKTHDQETFPTPF